MFTLPRRFARRAALLFATCTLGAAAGVAATDPGNAGGAANATGTGPVGQAVQGATQAVTNEVTPLNTLETQSVYVFTAPFEEKEFRAPGPNAPDGRQSSFEHLDELENTFEYGHRVHLFDRVYLKLGVEYKRYDFGQTNAPLPSTLSALHGEINFEYIVQGNVASFVNFNPGVLLRQFQGEPWAAWI